MEDDQESRGYGAATLLLFIAFVTCVVIAFHTSRRFVAHRPQAAVVPTFHQAEKIDKPAPTLTTEDGATLDLRPSADLPQEAHEESNDVPAADPQAQAPHEEITPDASSVNDLPADSGREEITPRHVHHHARRRHHHFPRHAASYRRPYDCVLIECVFLDTARGAGLIK